MLGLLAVVADETRHERLFVLADIGFDRPVFTRLEGFDFKFTLNDHSQGRALYPTRRQTALYFLPEQRRKIKAHQVVERTARLLRTNKISRNLAWISNGILHGLLRDLVEDDTMYVLVSQNVPFFEKFDQVPGDCFAFPVRVSRKVQGISFLQRTNNRVYVLFVAFDDLILHRKLVFGIDRAFLRHEIANMTV